MGQTLNPCYYTSRTWQYGPAYCWDGKTNNQSISDPIAILFITLACVIAAVFFFALFYWAVILGCDSDPLEKLGLRKSSTATTTDDLPPPAVMAHVGDDAKAEESELPPSTFSWATTTTIEGHHHHRRHFRAPVPPPKLAHGARVHANAWDRNHWNTTFNGSDREMNLQHVQHSHEADNRVYVMPHGIPFGHHSPGVMTSSSSNNSNHPQNIHPSRWI